MKNFFVILMIVASSFIPFVAFAQVNFMRDLFVGISGSDVFDLQKILNSDPETKISDSGVGAPGNETTYFGNLTKLAVQKFQIKYSDYVLKPIGLAVPTGYVGAFTRDFLNKTFNNISNNDEKSSSIDTKTSSVNTTTSTTKAISTVDSNQKLVTLKSISQDNVVIGQPFEINGVGFLKTSEVYLSSDGKEIKIDGVEYIDSAKLKVTVSNKIKAGIYLVYIQNAVENDTRWNSPLFILVSNKKIENSSDAKIKEAFDLMKENNSKFINKIEENSKIVSVENMINVVNEAENINGQKGFVGLAVSVGNVLKGLVFNEALAQASGGGGASQKTYWGGHIAKVTYCTCYYSFGIILKIKEKNSSGVGGGVSVGTGGVSAGASVGGNNDLKVVYQILISTLRANYNIFKAGANTIGGWTQTSFTCEDTSGYTCTNSTSETDTIDKRIDFLRGIGTSGANSDDYQGGGQ